MEKERIYELRIDDEDPISGVDQISLVDEPAIEVNWVAFNKHKNVFHIPENEDEKYLEMLMSKAELEEDLFKQGYIVDFIEVLDGKDDFATNPNAESEWDEDEFKIRYKYMLNPRITGQASVISTTREFCRDLVNKNYVWRVEEMDSLTNEFGESALVWRGGYNCRHVWGKIRYKKDATIINKASINKGKADVGGFPSGLAPDLDVIGYEQPNTVTNTVIRSVEEGTAKPSTIRNLGLSKQQMEIDDQNVNVFGYHTRYFALCPGAQALFKHLSEMPNVSEDAVGMIRSAAQAADNVFRIEYEVLKEQNATEHQYEEAVVLVDDMVDIMTEVDNIVGMDHDVSFMYGHLDKIADYVKEELGYDVGGITGYVDPGITGKTRSKFETYNDYPEAAKNNACKVLRWRDEHGDEVRGMTRVGWTRANQLCKGENISESTIARMAAFARHRRNAEVSPEFKSEPWKDRGYVAWLGWGGTTGVEWAANKLESIRKKQMSKQEFATDDEKRVVMGPAMIPELKIFRKDGLGNPYYVFFSAETIKMIAEKYMRNKYLDNNDEMHNGKPVQDVYVIESWIKESYEDKSNKFGYQHLPLGTWFVSMKVRNDETWNKIKKGDLKGFSVSGYFEEIERFAREEMFLKQLAELLKKID